MKKRILLKIGGLAFEGKETFAALANCIKNHTDVEFIIVHGGGAEISQALKDANRPTQFIDGIRVTEKVDVEIVKNVLSETVNTRLAGHFEKNGVKPFRMSGETDGTLIAEPIRRQGKDYGFVGQIKDVNPQTVWKALNDGALPIVSPISADENGNSYNVNADSAAAALAAGAECTDLIYFTDVPGVMVNGNVLHQVNIAQMQELIDNGTIQGGMVAKMESAFDALKTVERVHITQWENEEKFANLVENKSVTGTVIQK